MPPFCQDEVRRVEAAREACGVPVRTNTKSSVRNHMHSAEPFAETSRLRWERHRMAAEESEVELNY